MNTNPLVLIALDATDWRQCQKFIARGKMPNLERLMKSGSYGILQDEESICDLGLFNVIFSGQTREEIGYIDFRQIIQGTYNLIHDVEGEDFGDNPFWGQYHGTQAKVCILDVYDARLLPELNGVQVGQWTINNMKRKTVVYPQSLLNEIPALQQQLNADQVVPSTVEASLKVFEKLKARINAKQEVYSKILKKDNYDFIAIGFGEIHCADHQFFDFNENDPNHKKALLGTAAEEIYHMTDKCIGALLQLITANANVVVVSQSGILPLFPFESFVSKVCQTLGYQKMKSKSLAAYLSPLNWYRSIFPQAFRFQLSRILLTKKQRDQQLTDSFENGTDWSTTKVFAYPTMFHLFLKVNLIGREPQGTVSLLEYDQLIAEIMEDLKLFVDSTSQQPIFKKITKVKGTLSVEIPFKLPDIMASFNSFDYFVKTITHPKGYVIHQEENFFFRSNEHSDYGFFVASGSDIPKYGEMKDVNFKDMAPTLTALAGIKNDLKYRGENIFTNNL